uniref:Uncharacterized protein n=1 Tax=Otolemur garnettii TaxID=30611 RepID=H0XI32_OTOGA
MDNCLSLLKSISATWLNPSSTSWMTDTILGLLCGLGLFLLLFPCLGRDPSSPWPGQNKNIRKKRGRRRSKKKSCSLKACRDCQRELEGAQDLILLLQSSLGKIPDKEDFHQISYQDPPVQLCTPVPARAHQPHGKHVEDASLATSSQLASPTPLAECPPPLASTLSPGPMISPVCDGSHSSLSASQVPETLLPLECPSSQLRASSPSTPWAPASMACPLPPHSRLAHPQCDLIAPPLGTVPQGCASQDNCWVPISTILGLGHSSNPISVLSWWQEAARASRTWCLSTLPQDTSQGHLSSHAPKASFWGDATHRQMEAGGSSFVSPSVQNLLEILITKRAELKLWKNKDKEGSFLKHMSPHYPQCSLGDMLKSPSGELDTTTPHSFWKVTDKPEQLLGPQQFSHPKAVEGHLQQKCSQLFWGLPTLHSESLVAAAWVSSSPLEFPLVLFNVFSNSFTVQIQAKLHSHLLLPQTWHHHMAPPQPLTQTLSQLQPPPLSETHTQAHLPPCLSTPPCYLPQINFCGVPCPAVHTKAQFPVPTAIQQLECHLLKKQQESRGALPTIVRKSQEVFNQLTLDSWAFHTHSSVSRSLGDIIKPEFQEQLERHLQERLTQHWCTIPFRNQLSLGRVQPQGTFPGLGETKEKQGSAGPFVFAGESSEDTQEVKSQGPAMLLLWKNSSLDLRHCLGSVQKDLFWDSENSPATVPVSSFEEESERDVLRLSGHGTKRGLPGSPCQNHLEDILKVHLSKKLAQIKENRIPMSVLLSRLSIDQVLAPPENSDMHVDTGNLSNSKSWEFYREKSSCREEPLQELILDPSTQRVLKVHVKRLQVRRRWGLPLKIIRTKNQFMSKKPQSLPLPHSTFPSWNTYEFRSNYMVTNFLGEDAWKSLDEKPVLTLAGLLPAHPLKSEDIRLNLRGTQTGDNCGYLEALSTGQGRWSSQPLLGRSWHELTVGFQPLGAQETKEQVEAEEEKPLAWKAILADSHMLNVSLSSGSLGNRKSSSPSTIYITQDPEDSCLNVKIVGGCELMVEAKPEKQPQGPAPDNIPQDCTTHVVLGDHASEVLLTVDFLASQTSLSSSHSKSSDETEGSCDLSSRGESSQGLQETESLKLEGSWGVNPSEILGHTDEGECFRIPQTGGQEQTSVGPRASLASEMSHPAQHRELAELLRDKSSQLLPNERQVSTGSCFRNKMRQILHQIFHRKGPGQKENLQKCKSASAIAQCWAPITSRSFIDGGMAEGQESTITIGQIPEEKMGLHHELSASKGSWYKELWAPLGEYCSYHRNLSHLEQRKMMGRTVCCHHAT